jgi:hypothetical protein
VQVFLRVAVWQVLFEVFPRLLHGFGSNVFGERDGVFRLEDLDSFSQQGLVLGVHVQNFDETVAFPPVVVVVDDH